MHLGDFYARAISFQVGNGALKFDDSSANHAIFGPYDNLCITSFTGCVGDSTIGFWVKIASGCNGYIMSTRDATGYDGIGIKCSGGWLSYIMNIGSSTAQTMVLGSTGTWFYVVLTSRSMSASWAINVYHRPGSNIASAQASSSASNPSVEGKIVFGRQFVTNDNGNHGKAWVDDVRIYNRRLGLSEVNTVYNSYTN